MRIAIVSQSYPPVVSGVAIFSEKLAQSMAARGHQVLVFTPSDQPKPYRQQQPNLLVERCRSYRNPARLAHRFAFWPYHEIRKSLSKFGPDVIHLQDPLQIALSCLSYNRPHKIPVILTTHALPMAVSAAFRVEDPFRRVMEAGLWRYARWILRHCNGIVVSTQTVAETVCAHTGLHPQIISCGVDLDQFTPGPLPPEQEAALRSRLGIPGAVPIILHVGRLDKDKQVRMVVEAARRTMQQTQAHLLMVGDGTERARLKQVCAQLGIAERCHFSGFVSLNDGLPALYQTASVFIMASVVETQGLVLLEAAACAKPIIAFQSTSLHEIVHEGKNGFLVAPGDIQALADRLTWLVQNPSLALEMGKAGREIAVNHDYEKTVEAYESLYRSTLQSAQPTVPAPTPRIPVRSRTARSGESG